MQAYRSSTWRRVTLRERIPPPTGVVSGPLMATRCARMLSSVASGSQVPTCLKAFSPASTSSHSARRAPDVGSRAVSLDEWNDGVVRHHPTPVPEIDALAHLPTLPAKRAVYTPWRGLRQRKRGPYTSRDARHSETRRVHVGGPVLARRGPRRCHRPGGARLPPS